MKLTIQQIYRAIFRQTGFEMSLQTSTISIKVQTIQLPTGPLHLYISLDPLNVEQPIEITDDGDTLCVYQIPNLNVKKQPLIQRPLIPISTGSWRIIQFRLRFGNLHYLALTDEILVNTDLKHINQTIDTYIKTVQSFQTQLPGVDPA